MSRFLAVRSYSVLTAAAAMAVVSGAVAAPAPSRGFVTAPTTVAPPPQSTAPAPFRLNLASPSPLPAEGSYTTNDVPSFTLDRLGSQVRLRFTSSDEVFYLTSEPASLGGRVLRYDTGEIALNVAGWGGVTLYTPEAPWGVPAEHQTAPAAIDLKPVSAKEMRPLADKLTKDVAQHGSFDIGFAADWDMLAKVPDQIRELAVDSLRNAAYALEQMANEAEHGAIARTLHTVRIGPAPEPAVKVQKDALVVSYAPTGGPSARPSSLAIAHALEEAF